MIIRKGARWLLAVIMVMIMSCAMVTVPAFAVGLSNTQWFQATDSKITIDLSHMSPGPNINTSAVKCFYVATSPEDGEFSIVLQRKGLLGIWQNVDGNLAYRTGRQGGTNNYDPRNGGNVQGEPNMHVWSTNKSGEYRVILEKPTMPQVTILTRIEAWAV